MRVKTLKLRILGCQLVRIYAILNIMTSVTTWKIVDALVMGLIAIVIGTLFSWWIGAAVFLIGLVIVFRKMNKRPSFLSPKRQIMEEEESGEWLEEWHDDMRRWQIGPYEWRD